MFGYELIDILLFDLETLKASYASYLDAHKIAFYLGLIVNLVLIVSFKRAFRWLSFFLAFSWIYPGYFFYIQQFSSIYWPSTYFGLLALAAGALHMAHGLRGGPKRPKGLKSQGIFALATLFPVLLSYMASPESVMAMGTSASVAALAALSLHMVQKDMLSRVLSFISLAWCLIMGTILWALFQEI